MNQLIVRGFDDELAKNLRQLAMRDGTSLNQASLKLLRKGAGLSSGAKNVDSVATSLDHLIGSWSRAEADEMDAALLDFETIDESAWE